MNRAALVGVGVAVVMLHAPRARADDRDPGTATLLSIGGSLAPVVILRGALTARDCHPNLARALFGVGTVAVMIGPAAGHWYAGDYWTTGMTVRASGLAVVGLAIAIADDEDVGEVIGGVLIGVAGLIVTTVGTGIDVVGAGDAADAYNADARARAPMRMLSFGGRF